VGALIPASQYRWVIVGYSLVIQGVSVGILIYCFALFSLPWLDEFDASRRDVMITVSVLQIGMGVFGPIVGRVLDQFSFKWVVLVGLATLMVGLALVRVSTALWQVWLIYGTLMPLATILMGTLASQTLVAKWFTTDRGLALGISAMGTSLGGIIFPWLVAGWILEFGWREAISTLMIVAVVLVVPLTLLVLRRDPPEQGAPGTVPGDETPVGRIWTAREILTTSLFWIPFLSLVPLNMGFGALQFNLGVFTRDLGLDDAAAAPLIMISSVCMIIGKLFFGWLGDRLDHRILFWIAIALLACACLFLLLTDTYAGLVLGVICMGLSGGGILPMMGIIFGARFGAASFGRVMGFVMLNVTFGSLAPILAGWVYDATGSYDPALIGLLVLAVPAVIAMRWLPKPQID
jgi:MFS family permease